MEEASTTACDLASAATREFWKATEVLPAAMRTEAFGFERAKMERFALLEAEGWRLDGAEGGLDADLECAPEGLRALLCRWLWLFSSSSS